MKSQKSATELGESGAGYRALHIRYFAAIPLRTAPILNAVLNAGCRSRNVFISLIGEHVLLVFRQLIGFNNEFTHEFLAEFFWLQIVVQLVCWVCLSSFGGFCQQIFFIDYVLQVDIVQLCKMILAEAAPVAQCGLGVTLQALVHRLLDDVFCFAYDALPLQGSSSASPNLYWVVLADDDWTIPHGLTLRENRLQPARSLRSASEFARHRFAKAEKGIVLVDSTRVLPRYSVQNERVVHHDLNHVYGDLLRPRVVAPQRGIVRLHLIRLIDALHVRVVVDD